MIKFGIDVGNSTIKGTWMSDKNKIEHPIFAPSAISRIADEKFLTYASDTDRYVQVLDSPLEHFDDIIAIGEKAIDLPGYQQYDVGSTSYKANHEITTALLFGNIAQHVKRVKTLDVIIAVSIPIVEAKTLNVTENYKALLHGTHTIRVYDSQGSFDVVVNIVQSTVMNEGQAGFLGLLDTVDKEFQHAMMTVYQALGEPGNPIATLEDFLVVDIGEGTTDLAVFRKKRFNPEYSYSITRGYGNLLESAMATAQREGLTIESRKVLQDTLVSTNPRRKSRRERWEPYMVPEKQAFIEELAATILKAYGRQDFLDAIIFLGGGFTALTGYSIKDGRIIQRDETLFDTVDKVLEDNRKDVGLRFGIPDPFAQTINERGLSQVLSSQNIAPKK